MKNIIAFICAVAFAFGMFGSGGANVAAATSAKADKPSSWAAVNVAKAQELGLVTDEMAKGYQTPTTRAEFCRLAVRLIETYYDKPISAVLTERGLKPSNFGDTKDAAIQAAAALGITGGTGGGNFTPNRQLTRQEAAAMLKNVLDVIKVKSDTTTVKWKDRADIAAYAQAGADALYNAKIMGSMESGALVFGPKAAFTHEQAIVTALNLWNYAQTQKPAQSAHVYDMSDPNIKKYPIYATAKTAKEFQAGMAANGRLTWHSAAEIIAIQKNEDPDYMIDGQTFYDWRMKPIQKWVDDYCAANGLSYAGKTDDEKLVIVWHIRDSGRFEEFIGLWQPGFVLSDTDCATISDAGIFLMTAMGFELFDNDSGTAGSTPHAWNAYWSPGAATIKHFDLDIGNGRVGMYTDELDEAGYKLD